MAAETPRLEYTLKFVEPVAEDRPVVQVTGDDEALRRLAACDDGLALTLGQALGQCSIETKIGQSHPAAAALIAAGGHRLTMHGDPGKMLVATNWHEFSNEPGLGSVTVYLRPLLGLLTPEAEAGAQAQLAVVVEVLEAAIAEPDDQRRLDAARRVLDAAIKRSHPPLPRPALFAPDDLTVINAPYARAAVRGLWAPAQWTTAPNTFPYYNDTLDNVIVYLTGSDGSTYPTPATIEEAARAVLALNDRQVSTFLIAIGKWYADCAGSRHGPLQQTRVHVDDVLSFRGVQKHHKGGYRHDQKAEVREDLLFLRNVWVRSTQEVWEVDAHQRRRPVSVQVDSPLLEVEIESIPDMFTGESIPYAFRIRPGGWAAHYLNDGTHWTAKLLRPIMRYHPYRDRLAMRLGIYLTFQWGIRTKYRNFTQPWRMETLLAGAQILLPTQQRARFRKDVESALTTLHNSQILTACEALDPIDGNPAPKDWWPRWLAGRWQLTPPLEVQQQRRPRRLQPRA